MLFNQLDKGGDMFRENASVALVTAGICYASISTLHAQSELDDAEAFFARLGKLEVAGDLEDITRLEMQLGELFATSRAEQARVEIMTIHKSKGLEFAIEMDPHLPKFLFTDSKRLQQVLKNLLSNAFKFTSQGGVKLSVSAVVGGWTPDHPVLSQSPVVVAFEVSDTGIGIPLDKQKIIFEAFQQADASTSRKFGGTGLGLAISRELAALLGGEIQLRSRPEVGSTFTLFLPLRYVGASSNSSAASDTAAPPPVRLLPTQPERSLEPVADDRNDLAPGEPLLLVVEDDPHYMRIMIDLAHEKGFKVVATARGEDAVELAKQYQPTAISLDVFLPDMLGWNVLSHIKQDPLTRHIPVQIVTLDEDRQHALSRGAFAFVPKPTTPQGLSEALARIKAYAQAPRRRLLVIEDNEAEQKSIGALLDHDDIEIVTATTGAEALTLMGTTNCDCVVLDLSLPDMSGFEVLEKMRIERELADIPVVVFTGRQLSPEEDAKLHSMARSIVVKGVESPERLLDETALFLHRVVTDLPPEKQRLLERLHSSDEDLIGRTVLLVDDDARNIFALASVLERRGMKVLSATTGKEAIALRTRCGLIGADSGTSYKSDTVQVPPGASLYLFSDGVFEIVTNEGLEWRLSDFIPHLLQPREPAESQRLFQAVRKLARPGGLEDDFSLLVLTFE